MNLDPAPRVSKTVFLLIDAGLLVTAFSISYLVKDPFAPLPFVLSVLCIALAAVVGLMPYLIDYAADSAEYVQAERAKIADHVQRLNAASESLARAAAQIKAVEEAVHKSAHAAENLPYRMQEKLAEFNQQLAQTEDEEKERLTEELTQLRQSESERLQTIADKIHKAAGELSSLEATARKQLAAAQDAAAGKFETRLNAIVAAAEAKLATLSVAVVAAPAPAEATPGRPTESPVAVAPVAETKPEPEAPAAPAPIVESVSVTEAPVEPAPAAEPKPKKPRAPRKPKPEDTLAAMSEPMPGDVPAESSGESTFPDSPADTAPAPAEETTVDLSAEAAAKPEPSVSADGATRLLVTAYIGIGNKLYIRGDGPGLSWDKGVPMKFVSIGKWGWSSDEATGPVACKLYKNDETAALSGEIFLEPGQHVEVTALF
ncbi:MAG TPA: hypothetical protein VF388_07435 [Lacunisphaera sp.]